MLHGRRGVVSVEGSILELNDWRRRNCGLKMLQGTLETQRESPAHFQLGSILRYLISVKVPVHGKRRLEERPLRPYCKVDLQFSSNQTKVSTLPSIGNSASLRHRCDTVALRLKYFTVE